MNIKVVEKPNSSEASVLANFDAQCFGSEALTEENWIEVISSNAVVFYAEEDHLIVGAAVLKLTKAKIAYLYSLCILPEHRKKGYGWELLRSRIYYCLKKGIFRIQAHTRVDNLASGSLLLKEGFKSIAYIPDFYGNFEDGILWEKQI